MTTHPTGPAGTGPGRILATLLARTHRAVAAATAGARARIITPLTAEQRVGNYRRQTGRSTPTPRQQRRINHKAARAAVRAS